MGKQFAAISTTLFFLVSLFLLGCGANNGGNTVPRTTMNDSDINGQYPSAGGTGGGGELPTIGGIPGGDGGSTPGLPNVGAPSAANLGGINAPQGTNLSDFGSQFASAWQNLFGKIGSFDPRAVPEAAKGSFNNFMCAMREAGFYRLVAQQMTLPEFVASLYINVLHRAPESQDAINFHSVVVIQSGTRVAVRGFILSEERLETVVRNTYRYFFGSNRSVSQPEVNGWKSWIKNHQDTPGGFYTLERMYASFLGSPEFFNLSSNDPRKYTINMYRYALGRTPSEGEIQFWMNGRNFMTPSVRVEAALGFFESDEYRLTKIGQMIRTFWARPVTGDELAIRLQAMKNGRDQLITMTDLLTDPRYFERVHLVWNPFSAFAQNGQCGQ